MTDFQHFSVDLDSFEVYFDLKQQCNTCDVTFRVAPGHNVEKPDVDDIAIKASIKRKATTKCN